MIVDEVWWSIISLTPSWKSWEGKKIAANIKYFQVSRINLLQQVKKHLNHENSWAWHLDLRCPILQIYMWIFVLNLNSEKFNSIREKK